MVQIVLPQLNLRIGIMVLFLCQGQSTVQFFQLLGKGLNLRLGKVALQFLQGSFCLALFGLLAADSFGAGQQVLTQGIQLLIQIQHPALPQLQLFLALRNGPVLFPIFLAQVYHLLIGGGVLFIGKSPGQRQDPGAQIGKLFLLPLNPLRTVVQGTLPAFHLPAV